MRIIALFAALFAAAALTGCGSDDEDAAEPGSAAVSIEDAVAADTDEPQLVSGNLLAAGGEVRLCYALAESFPPQCGGPSLLVEGLELEDVDGIVNGGGVSWTDRPIELLGVVEGETLTVG